VGSSNTIDQITIFSSTPDICINGDPVATRLQVSIPPGTTQQVCVTLTGCTAPLVDGVDIDFDILLEDSSDPDYCCHSETTVTTPACCIADLNCTDYTNTVEAKNNDPAFYPILQGTSEVSTTIFFDFYTYGNPDQLVVTINGSTALNSGSWSSTGSNCNFPANGHFQGQVNVNVCDEIDITVFGNSENCGAILWDLSTWCASTVYFRNEISNTTSSVKDHYNQSDERLAQASQESLMIFPNPVRDILNIRNAASEISYRTVNIMDSSGKTIRTQDMTGISDLQIDVSVLPIGTYIMTITDDLGNETVEKFIKVE